MIVRDEEAVLARCLASVKDAVDEIIIVDTGSTDRTKEIAASFQAKIYDFEWTNHFSNARNFSFDQATSDYILWLDADDVLLPADAEALKQLKQQTPFPYDSVTFKYHLTFDDKGDPTYSFRRNRLVKRSNNFRWHGAVHEYLAVHGSVMSADIAVVHKKERTSSNRNLNIYLQRLADGESFSPRDQFYFANELRDHAKYEDAIEWYETFLNGGQGWIEDNIAACMRQSICYNALQQPEKSVRALLRALQYDRPRPDFCCQLGSLFMQSKQFNNAVYWYKQATQTAEYAPEMGFHNPATTTWLPHLQLTVCYDRMGDYKNAIAHHNIAKQIHPTHPSVIFNENYYASKGLLA